MKHMLFGGIAATDPASASEDFVGLYPAAPHALNSTTATFEDIPRSADYLDKVQLNEDSSHLSIDSTAAYTDGGLNVQEQTDALVSPTLQSPVAHFTSVQSAASPDASFLHASSEATANQARGGSEDPTSHAVAFGHEEPTAAIDNSLESVPSATSDVLSAAAPYATIPQLADYLVNGYWSWDGEEPRHWASNTITYNLGDLNTQERADAVAALALWSSVANISVVQTNTSADINFNHDGSGAATSASVDSNGYLTSATVSISSSWYPGGFGSYMFQSYIHEIGHALGLGHEGPYNGTGTYGVDNVFANDTWQWSVMSYFSQNNYGGATTAFVVTPEMADIYAIQSLYGEATTNTGDTIYGFNSNAGSVYDFSQYGTPIACTIYDSGGNDTLDCSGYSANQTINLTPGTWSNVGGDVNNVGIWQGTLIENAVGGSGSDSIIGNSLDNNLQGGAGTDTISAGDGNDHVDGGSGADSITGGSGDDTLFGGTGADFISGDAGNDSLVGDQGYDTLTGGDGNNSLYSGLDGASMSGGNGDDYLEADHGPNYGDGGAGDDTIVAYNNSTGSITGGDGNDSLYAYTDVGGISLGGGAGDDYLDAPSGVDHVALFGDAGNDTLAADGYDDSMYGGSGNDDILGNSNYGLYITGNQGSDTIDLSSGSGNDTVFGGQDGDTIYGSHGSDFIAGNLGDDSISGGDGADTIFGGQDSDTIDGGSGDDFIAGNLGNDSISGGDGTDTIYGGQDSDTIDGGSGDDFIAGNLAADTILGGSGDDTLFGGQGNDSIDGGDNADTIYGNKGIDTLTGGAGNDQFVFNSGDTAYDSAGGGNADQIADFTTHSDVIEFTGGPAGTTADYTEYADVAATNLNTAMADATAHIGSDNYIFVAGTTDGYLFYSAAGDGNVDEVVILDGHDSLAGFDSTDILGA